MAHRTRTTACFTHRTAEGCTRQERAQRMTKVKTTWKGLLLCVLLALPATFLGRLLPVVAARCLPLPSA